MKRDPAQEAIIPVLQDFAERLEGYHPPKNPIGRWLFRHQQQDNGQGLYLYGDVGRGKSMLMDLLFAAVHVERKRRVHFHQFMLEIQARLYSLRNQNLPDILQSVAMEIADQAWLLAFDEFHVGNIADAMILGRLFEALFKAGVMIIITSNWAPDMLYKNGLQRERFLPFIDLIKQRVQIVSLSGAVDHRFERLRGLPTYFYPLGEESTLKLRRIFLELTLDHPLELIILPVQGRELRLTHAVDGVGFFSFDELCVNPLAAADYQAIAGVLDTVFIDGVPRMEQEKTNETMRFMTLIDVFYEAKIKLFMAADAPLQDLAPKGELAYPFQRTISRLAEMQGDKWQHRLQD